jgi:hypothetical protein
VPLTRCEQQYCLDVHELVEAVARQYNQLMDIHEDTNEMLAVALEPLQLAQAASVCYPRPARHAALFKAGLDARAVRLKQAALALKEAELLQQQQLDRVQGAPRAKAG